MSVVTLTTRLPSSPARSAQRFCLAILLLLSALASPSYSQTNGPPTSADERVVPAAARSYAEWRREFDKLAQFYMPTRGNPFTREEEISVELDASRRDDLPDLSALVKRTGKWKEFLHVRDALRADDDAWRGPFALDYVSYARRNPLRAAEVAYHLAAPFNQPDDSAEWGDLMSHMAHALNLTIDPPARETPTFKTIDDLAGYCTTVLSRAAQARNQAFSKLTDEELAFLYRVTPQVMRGIVDHLYISVPQLGSRDVREEYYRLYRAARDEEVAVRSARPFPSPPAATATS